MPKSLTIVILCLAGSLSTAGCRSARHYFTGRGPSPFAPSGANSRAAADAPFPETEDASASAADPASPPRAASAEQLPGAERSAWEPAGLPSVERGGMGGAVSIGWSTGTAL